MSENGRDKDTRLSVREFVFISAAIASAMASWIPKGMLGSTTPEVAELKAEIRQQEADITKLTVQEQKLQQQFDDYLKQQYNRGNDDEISPQQQRRR